MSTTKFILRPGAYYVINKNKKRIHIARDPQKESTIYLQYSHKGKKKIIMSKTTYDSLDKNQITSFTSFGDICYTDVPTIEQVGGGGIRCLMTEIFLKSCKINPLQLVDAVSSEAFPRIK